MDREKVVVAELLRPRGNRGEVLARSVTDIPGRLEHLKQANVLFPDGANLSVEITAAWMHKGDWVFKFSGVDSISAAERFRGADLWLPADQRAALPAGEFFRSDLIACQVIDRSSGNCLGVVENWQDYGGPPLMQVASHGREVLIPFVPAYCQVDLAARTVHVDVPEGLLDL
jgi:16S rRNA processing protein RimM